MNALERYKRHIPFLVVLAIISLVMTGHGGSKHPKAGEWLAFEDPLATPDASFLLPDGKRGTLADFKGKPVLINIWATWCPPCVKEMPTLIELQKQHKELVVLSLSIDKAPMTQVEAYLKEHQLSPQHLAQDDSGKIYSELGVQGLPVSYIVTPEGSITHRFIGGTDWTNKQLLAPVETTLGIKAK